MKAYKKLFKKAGSYLHDSEKMLRKSKVVDSNTLMIVAGFAAGLVAGAALGILFAPDKGTETRHAIGSRAKDLGNSVADKARQGADRIATLKDQAVDTVKSKLGGSDSDVAAT